MSQSVPALTLGETTVRQLDGLYSLNDLHRASGGNPSHRPGNFLQIDQTKALVAEIETAGIPAVSTREGRNGGTYACRELVIAYAAWISAAFHLKVIRVFLASQAPSQGRWMLQVQPDGTPHLSPLSAHPANDGCLRVPRQHLIDLMADINRLREKVDALGILKSDLQQPPPPLPQAVRAHLAARYQSGDIHRISQDLGVHESTAKKIASRLHAKGHRT